MRVDFYQLGALSLDQVIAALAEKLLVGGERLLVIGSDDAQLARLDRVLWDQGPASFLPHAVAGGTDDARQPLLLSRSPDAANRARNILIADGNWREAALAFERAFYLFDKSTLEGARSAWRSLAGRADVEKHYWANENGRWTEKAGDARQGA